MCIKIGGPPPPPPPPPALPPPPPPPEPPRQPLPEETPLETEVNPAVKQAKSKKDQNPQAKGTGALKINLDPNLNTGTTGAGPAGGLNK